MTNHMMPGLEFSRLIGFERSRDTMFKVLVSVLVLKFWVLV